MVSCNNLQIAVSFLAVERCKTFLLLAYGVISRWINPVHWDSGWIRLLFSPKPATATFLLLLLLLLLAPAFVYIPAFAFVIATARRNCWLGFSVAIAAIAATIAISSCCGLGGFLACGFFLLLSFFLCCRILTVWRSILVNCWRGFGCWVYTGWRCFGCCLYVGWRCFGCWIRGVNGDDASQAIRCEFEIDKP